MLEQYGIKLNQGEVVLWQGKGNPKKWLAYNDFMYIPFSLMWCAFVVYWEVMSIRYHYPPVFYILGIPFTCLGLYMAFGRYVYKYFKKQNSLYLLTNQRVIEHYTHGLYKSREMSVDQLGRMVRFVEKDGHGTLLFNDVNPAYIMKVNDGMEWLRPRTYKIVGFYDVPELETLYALVQSLKTKPEA